MKTTPDYEHDYLERIAIMTENGEPESQAHVEATYQVRSDMVANDMDFYKANIQVMGVRNKVNKILGGV